MADQFDFSNIGKGIDTQMGQAALTGQQIGYNDATLPGRIGATNATNAGALATQPGAIAAANAGNAASVSNSGLAVNNNQRQIDYQMAMSALGPNPSMTDLQNLAQQYPEFSGQIQGLQRQQVANIASIRAQMTPDAVATVAGMKSLIAGGDINGALNLLEQRAQRLEASGDPQNAAATRQWEGAIRTNPQAASAFADQILNSGTATSPSNFYGSQVDQAKGYVATNTAPGAVAATNAGSQAAVATAPYAAPKAAADIGYTQSSTNVNNTQAGVNGAIPRSELPALNEQQTKVNQGVVSAKQYGNMANTWDQVNQTGALPTNLAGYSLDKATGNVTTDSSTRQQLGREQSSLVAGAEQAGIVQGNVTDASVSRALQGVPPEGSSASVWADYWRSKQRIATASADYQAAALQFQRNNGNDPSAPAKQSFTMKLPSGQTMLVDKGDRMADLQQKIVAPFYAPPGNSGGASNTGGSSGTPAASGASAASGVQLPSYGF